MPLQQVISEKCTKQSSVLAVRSKHNPKTHKLALTSRISEYTENCTVRRQCSTNHCTALQKYSHFLTRNSDLLAGKAHFPCACIRLLRLQLYNMHNTVP